MCRSSLNSQSHSDVEGSVPAVSGSLSKLDDKLDDNQLS